MFVVKCSCINANAKYFLMYTTCFIAEYYCRCVVSVLLLTEQQKKKHVQFVVFYLSPHKYCCSLKVFLMPGCRYNFHFTDFSSLVSFSF